MPASMDYAIYAMIWTLSGSTEVPTVLVVYVNMVQYWKQGYYLLIRKKMQVSETSRSKLLVPTSL